MFRPGCSACQERSFMGLYLKAFIEAQQEQMNLLSSVVVQKPVSQRLETWLFGKGRRSSGLNFSQLVQKED